MLALRVCKIRGFGDFFRNNCSPKINKNIIFYLARNFSTFFDIFLAALFDSFWKMSKTIENCQKQSKAVEYLLNRRPNCIRTNCITFCIRTYY